MPVRRVLLRQSLRPPLCYHLSQRRKLGPPAQALHPTQLYDAGLDLLITALLLALTRTRWANRSGTLTALYLILAGGARLAVEPFRADARGAGLGMFSATGLMAIGIILAGTFLIMALPRRKHL